MRRHGLKKGLSLLLVFCMILSLLPMTALAEEISEPSAAVEEQSPASGDTTAVDTGEDQQDEAGTGETDEAGTGETGEAGTGEAAEAGTGETGEADTGEESKSVIDKITDILGDFLGTISGEKSEEEAAQDEANAKAAELALSKAAAEEAAAQQAEEEAAAKAAAEQLEAELEAVLTVEATKDARDTSGDDFYKVVHLDAGRKYFSVESIKAIIDTMADAGYNQLELYLSDNQGFRFALDNMTITTSYGTYDLSLSLGDGYSDGSKYPDGSGKYLTQADMDTIIDYAEKNHIEIVPCINTPGHMGAILEKFSDFRYSGSRSSIDLENPKAVAFALAIVKKYADYFAGKGCDFFNIGADEYANDLSTMGFAGLYSSGKYQRFVDYLNAAAQIVINEGMTPRAFNDGIYYNNKTSYSINKAIQVCYWSSGWEGYELASAATISQQGHDMINTHGDYYWVLGNSSWQCSVSNASGFAYNDFQGTSGLSADGAMFCIWCDVGNADGQDDGDGVVSATADVITAFGSALPVADRGNGTAEHPYVMTDEKNADVLEGLKLGESCYLTMDKEVVWKTSNPDVLKIDAVGASAAVSAYALEESEGVNATTVKVTATGIGEATLTAGTTTFGASVGAAKKETVTVAVGETATVPVSGANYAGTYTTDDPSIATVKVTGTDASEATTTYTQASVTCSTLISSNSDDWAAAGSYYYKADDGNYYPVYAKRSSTESGGFDNKQRTYTYTWGYKADSSSEPIEIKTQTTTVTRFITWPDDDATPNITVYTKSGTDGTPASTTITFTGVHVGTTSVTIGDTEYIITVIPEDLSNVTLTVEFWITNLKVTAGGATSKRISAEDVYGKSGVDLSTLLPSSGTYAYGNVVYWKGTVLDAANKQTTAGGVENDKTGSGKDFSMIRYYDSAWQYYYNNTWESISDTDQVVAYWLQPTEVTQEITTLVKDWGFSPSNQGDNENKVALTVAVVYPDGTVSPAEGDMYSKSTTLFNYWTNRDIGLVAPLNNSDYEISKITVTDGARDQSGTGKWGSNDTITWEKDTLEDGSTWYKETTYWDETVGGTPMVNGLTSNITWPNYNTAKLVLIYLKPIHYDSNLIVKWVDDSSNGAVISTMEVAVSSDGTPITFYNGLKQTSALPTEGVGGTFTLDDDAYVTNSSNVNQTFNKNIATVPGVAAQYKSGLYQYVSAELSDDDMTLTLHYNINTDLLAKQYVVDFGLPVTVPLSELVKNPSDVTTIEVTAGSATLNGTSGITYQPSDFMSGVETVRVKLTFNGDNTNTQTYSIAFIPATTVYYEQGFAEYSGSGWTNQDYVGTATQALEVVGGQNQNVYGYDSAYAAGGAAASGNTAAESKAVGDTASFSFTGTGVDIYANCGMDTGTVLITVKNGSNIVKVLTVDTHMENGLTPVTGSANDKQSVAAKNVPIASIDGLAYDSYSVTIKHVISKLGANKSVYLDGFRVHGTLGPTHDAYKADGENSPKIVELRDLVLNVQLNADASSSDLAVYKEQLKKLTDSQIYKAAVISDGISGVEQAAADAASVKDLVDNGPKNEVYLAPGETLVFTIDQAAQVGVKCLNGDSGKIGSTGGTDTTVTAQTDMFYAVKAGEVRITATNGTLAVTELKFTSNT